MNKESDLPADVLDAIHANRKIQAIKRLREHRKLGLREAKEAIEAHMRARPNPPGQRHQQAETGMGRLILIGVLAAAAYLAYRVLA